MSTEEEERDKYGICGVADDNQHVAYEVLKAANDDEVAGTGRQVHFHCCSVEVAKQADVPYVDDTQNSCLNNSSKLSSVHKS
jgi:hypothetical protein